MTNKRTSAFRYMELAAVLRAQIVSGSVKPGELLLSEHELCHKYAMSRNSVRQALEILTSEGLVERRNGVGTTVLPNASLQNDKNNLVILTDYPLAYVRHCMPPLIEMFKEKYPRANVKLISMPYTEKHREDNPERWSFQPDLMLISDEYFSRQSMEFFYPLSLDVRNERAISDKLLQPYQAGNTIYALPLTFSPIFMVCNRDLFRKQRQPMPKANWKLDEFIGMSQNLTTDANGDGIIDTFGFGLSTKLSRWATVVLKCGFDLRDLGKKRRVTEADRRTLVEALKLMQDLVHRHQVSPTIAARDLDWLHALFYEGRVAMVLTSTFFNVYKVPFHSEIMPFPANPEIGDTGNVLISLALCIPRAGTNPELAKIFCEFAHDPGVHRLLLEKTGLLCSYDSVNRERFNKRQYEAMGLDMRSMRRSHYIYELFSPHGTADLVEKRMRAFWAGLLTPEETADMLIDL